MALCYSGPACACINNALWFACMQDDMLGLATTEKLFRLVHFGGSSGASIRNRFVVFALYLEARSSATKGAQE